MNENEELQNPGARDKTVQASRFGGLRGQVFRLILNSLVCQLRQLPLKDILLVKGHSSYRQLITLV